MCVSWGKEVGLLIICSHVQLFPDAQEAFAEYQCILDPAPAVNTHCTALPSRRECSWVRRQMGELKEFIRYKAISNIIIKEMECMAVLVSYGCYNNDHKFDLRRKPTQICYLTVLHSEVQWGSHGSKFRGFFRAMFLLDLFWIIHCFTFPVWRGTCIPWSWSSVTSSEPSMDNFQVFSCCHWLYPFLPHKTAL